MDGVHSKRCCTSFERWLAVPLVCALATSGLCPTHVFGQSPASREITAEASSDSETSFDDLQSAPMRSLTATMPSTARGALLHHRSTAELPRLDNGDIDVAQILATRGSVSFRQTPLSDVIFAISSVWGVNIVAGQNVDGQVSGSFNDVPLTEVLSAVLSANNYAYKRTGSTLIVLPADQIGQDDATFITKVIALRSGLSNSEPFLETARMLLSPRGEIRSIHGTSNILVVDSSDRVAQIEELFVDVGGDAPPQQPGPPPSDITTLPADLPRPAPITQPPSDTGLGIAYFSPQFTDATNLAEALTGAMDPDTIISLFGDENRIIVRGNDTQLQLASQIVSQLDRPRPQVRITALIYDVGLDEIAKLGIDWSHTSTDGALTTGSGTGLLPTSADGAVLEGTNLALTLLKDKISITSALNALNSTEGAKLLADPSVTVADRNEALMKIVQKIPITTIGQLGDSAATFQSIEFEEAGIILTVTPRISRDGTVQMDVSTEFSVLTGNLNGQPIIDTRTADTSVRVANGQSFVLGGLRQKSVNEKVKGVPYLKDMRHFGKYFRSHETEVTESELIVFIKPEIVGPFNNATPREAHARSISNLQLDRIAVADECPFVPDCGNPYCPNHHPQPRVNAGGSSQLIMIGGFGIEGLPPVSLPIDEETLFKSQQGMPLEPAILPPQREQRYRPQATQPYFETAGRVMSARGDDAYSDVLDAPVHVRTPAQR